MNDRSPTELRRDPLTGRRVIVAAQRSQRPNCVGTITPDAGHYDPFAGGNEHDTPAERLALRHVGSQPDQPGWLLRVVPNRYPAVTAAADDFAGDDLQSSHEEAHEEAHAGTHGVQAAAGVHEVVIECPDRRSRLADLSVVEITRILTAWQMRLQVLSQQPRISAVQIFRNEGAMAGASLPHCHSQILATQWFDSGDLFAAPADRGAAFQHWLKAELTAGDRIVASTEELVVVCPFASRVAWQVRFCRNIHDGRAAVSFGQLRQLSLQALATEVLRVVLALQRLQGEVPFNLVLKLPPVATPDAYPWFLDLMPRTGQFAGFELLATTTDIVTTAPETAAASYRDVLGAVKIAGTADMLWPPEYRWV